MEAGAACLPHAPQRDGGLPTTSLVWLGAASIVSERQVSWIADGHQGGSKKFGKVLIKQKHTSRSCPLLRPYNVRGGLSGWRPYIWQTPSTVEMVIVSPKEGVATWLNLSYRTQRWVSNHVVDWDLVSAVVLQMVNEGSS